MNSELRIKVAESLGWLNIHTDTETFEGLSVLCGNPKPGFALRALPAYDTSLDACHEFEKTIPHKGAEPTIATYANILTEIQNQPIGSWAACLLATPEQRCRAWLAYCERQKQKELR